MNLTEKSFLVSTDWLAAHLADPGLRLFDCTGILGTDYVNKGREAHYARHHIPGAAYLDVASPKGEMANPDAALPFTWPTAAQFEATLGRLGIDRQCRVILYSAPNPDVPGSGISWTTRAWWLMHHAGLDCAILDGGWQKWTREQRPVSSAPRTYPATTFKVSPSWTQGLALKADVLAAIGDESIQIVDSLSPESYRGEVDRNYGTFGSRKGHITSARNVNFQDMTNAETGCFLELAMLRRRFADGGVDPRRRIITYCGGGIGATVTGFALRLTGHDKVAIYDGSLMEWANDPTLPMTDPTLMAASGDK